MAEAEYWSITWYGIHHCCDWGRVSGLWSPVVIVVGLYVIPWYIWWHYNPRQQSSWGQQGAHLGPVSPRWAPCWPHEPCYQGWHPSVYICVWLSLWRQLRHLSIYYGKAQPCTSKLIGIQTVSTIPYFHGSMFCLGHWLCCRQYYIHIYIYIHTVKSLIWYAPNHKTPIILISSWSCFCPIYWKQVLSREWRCSWRSATGDAPTTSEWSTILLPTKVQLILNIWWYIYIHIYKYISLSQW